MNDVRVDSEGNLRCWKCGGKHFLEKRTGRAHIIGYTTFGVGALATKKKLKCYQCGEYNQVGHARAFDPQTDPKRVHTGLSSEDAFILVPAEGEVFLAEPILFRGRAIRATKTVNAVMINIQCLDSGQWVNAKGEFRSAKAPLQPSLSNPGKKETDWELEWRPPCTGQFEIHASTGVVGPMTASRKFEIVEDMSAFLEDDGPPPATAGEARAFSVADELRKLADLRAEGVLTDDEFETEKRRLLDRT